MMELLAQYSRYHYSPPEYDGPSGWVLLGILLLFGFFYYSLIAYFSCADSHETYEDRRNRHAKYQKTDEKFEKIGIAVFTVMFLPFFLIGWAWNWYFKEEEDPWDVDE